jgi:transitional endoplasmic reticulum ATPase
MAHSAQHRAAFQAFSVQAGAERCDTALTILNFLRQEYPKHHVTRASAYDFDLFGFAANGHADLKEELDLGFDATRRFQTAIQSRPPGRFPRLARRRLVPEGKLFDEVSFGRWSCAWNDHHYIVYSVEYTTERNDEGRFLFILSPFGSLVSQTAPHHPNTDALLLAIGTWSKELHEEINVFDGRCWRKDSKLMQSIEDTDWDDLIMDPDVKANLQRDSLDFFNNEELYHGLSVPWKRGIILHGVPGNGKTLTLKALIKTLAKREDPIPALYVKSLEAPGENFFAITTIFRHARKMSPCLLVFEDLDSLVNDKNRSYFLNEVDGLEDNKGLLMVGSTNHLNKLDSSITKRPSRFDRKYHFALPGEETRVAYCEYWRAKVLALPSDVDFPVDMCPVIAKWTEGFSFAYMKELFMSAMVLLVTGTHKENEYDDVLEDAECGSDDCSTVVVGRVREGEEKESAEAEKEEEEGGKQGEKTKKPPKLLPEVEIPVSVQENLLLSILRSQAKALLADMDDSSDKESDEE